VDEAVQALCTNVTSNALAPFRDREDDRKMNYSVGGPFAGRRHVGAGELTGEFYPPHQP
jgi:hypothetical protein